ncbi:AI-2E family transporter [Candidatus Bealeia paramacronuclearis]|uniref:AI-2E family transporter n=1 Tax=Candidatus Bealeia paramacronuclearis TaxID=1921001 RepID=A0ABZ2C5R4_9PROT|nr:AI-2E family transporter [Candidatus Bealeia paramacronuclearis]
MMLSDRARNKWLWIGIIGAFSLFIYEIRPILLPFITSFIVAYALSPLISKLEFYKINRGLGALLLVGAFFVFLATLLFMAIPFLQTELTFLVSKLPTYGNRLMTFLKPIIDDLAIYIKPTDLERLQSTASEYLMDIVRWLLRAIVSVLTSGLALANLISLIVITPIVSFYFLRDWNKMSGAIDSLLPLQNAPKIRNLLNEIDETIGGYARGQGLVCLTLGVYYATMLSIAGLDFSVMVGTIIGCVAFIPYVGAFIGFVLSLGIAFSQFNDWSSIGLVAGIFLVGQILEGYLLIPRFVGDRVGLHPVWVIFAILAGGVLYGFIGVLIALPMAAALGVVVRFSIQEYKTSLLYKGLTTVKSKKASEKTL